MSASPMPYVTPLRQPGSAPSASPLRRLIAVLALGLVAPAAAALAATAEPPPFTEGAAASGLDFVHFTGATGKWYFPEIAGAGGALLDYDGDGDLDLYLIQGAMLPPGADPGEAARPPVESSLVGGRLTDRLFRNDLQEADDGTRRLRFTDVTADAGLAGATGYGMGAAVGDYDGDGHPDLYVTNFGPNQLWRNRGDGTFEDVTAKAGAAAELGDSRWSVAAAFFDYESDGDLDLYVGNYVGFGFAQQVPCFGSNGARDYCGPRTYPPQSDRLLRNRGDGTFEDVTARAKLGKPGESLGVIVADFDTDGHLDLYVANDGAANFLWRAQGDGTFRDEALLRGCAVNGNGMAEASMGVDYSDLDGDGDEDLFMTHLDAETNTLYLNDGRGMFLDRSTGSGLDRASWSLTGFGTAGLDYDLDGRLDVFVANGAVKALEPLVRKRVPRPFHQPNQLFRNLGGGRFEDVTARSGPALEPAETSRGALFGDLDNDGDPDLVVTNNEGPVRLLLNRTIDGAEGDGANAPWIGLRLVDGPPGAMRDQPGTTAEVSVGGATWRRTVRPAASYASANDPRVLVGLGDAEGTVSVTAHWPGGAAEGWTGLARGRYHTLRKGTGEPLAGKGTKTEGGSR